MVLAGSRPFELAIATSRTLYERSPVVLLAPENDLAAQATGASVAVGLGVPLLVAPAPTAPSATPSGGRSDTDPLREIRDELERLEPATVLTVGAVPDPGVDGVSTVPVPTQAAAIGELTGTEFTNQRAVPEAELLEAVASLERSEPALLALDAAPPVAEESTDNDQIPPVEPAEPLDTVLFLVSEADQGGHASLAATATARAAGAQVVLLDNPDPRADSNLIALLGRQEHSHIVALGDRFGAPDRLRQRLAVAATGVELPGGGQVLFPGRRLVALYGHPGTSALGVLGEQPVNEAVERARRVAAEYEALVNEPVVPAFEIIATVASASPGEDGDYSAESSIEHLRPWVDAAREAGIYVVLDLQPGHTDFLTQARRYEELLREPHVGLALDPEWRLAPGQRHMVHIGSVNAAEVNSVVSWLADLTREANLPQKLLILHQFRLSMITDREQVDTGRDEVAVLIHADGHGNPAQKLDTWNILHRNPPPNVWWGWKNFYDEDSPTFSPQQTVAVEPSPVFISYQ